MNVVTQQQELIKQNDWDSTTIVDINTSINEGTATWASINQSFYDSSNDFCYVTQEDGANWILTKDRAGCHPIYPPRIRSLTNLGDALREYQSQHAEPEPSTLRRDTSVRSTRVPTPVDPPRTIPPEIFQQF